MINLCNINIVRKHYSKSNILGLNCGALCTQDSDVIDVGAHEGCCKWPKVVLETAQTMSLLRYY